MPAPFWFFGDDCGGVGLLLHGVSSLGGWGLKGLGLALGEAVGDALALGAVFAAEGGAEGGVLGTAFGVLAHPVEPEFKLGKFVEGAVVFGFAHGGVGVMLFGGIQLSGES
jgi:hypothetical protein